MQQARNSSGFVLVMVLVVLAVAGAILAAAAYRSSERAFEAGRAERALQRKWAFLSIQSVCLPQAERILTGGEELDEPSEGPPPVTKSFGLELGGARFDLVVGDEQAKANANLLAQRRGKRGLAESLRTLQSGGRRFLQVHLRPAKPPEKVISAVPQIYTSFDQLFLFEHPSELLASGPFEKVVSSDVTCWSSGKINFRRAERAVLREVLSDLLNESELDELLTFRREQPQGTLDEALRRLELPKERLAALLGLLTDLSQSHSLWIIDRGRTRNWYRLYVSQGGDAENDSGFWTFAWGP